MYVYGACLFYVCCSDCVGGLWECFLCRVAVVKYSVFLALKC